MQDSLTSSGELATRKRCTSGAWLVLLLRISMFLFFLWAKTCLEATSEGQRRAEAQQLTFSAEGFNFYAVQLHVSIDLHVSIPLSTAFFVRAWILLLCLSFLLSMLPIPISMPI